jgi:presequence protease
MTDLTDTNNPGLKIGQEIHGYRIDRIRALEEINAIVYRLEHIGTGARHLHISNHDRENTFGVTFKTVPTDSTGVAHILEHTVLCGSKNYPVRDPFFSMLKRSLSTFMNAFTASDWTMYPFATMVRKDFNNLLDVYLDAAFFPKLDELSFKQEGHRLEIEQEAEKPQLVYKGVVYNEMKGAMSSPNQVMSRSLLNALYPDTTYSNNSGGDPAVIPRLSHAQLVAFHRRHYHPSNAFFYTYGNMPLEGHLAVIADKVMRHFQPIDPQTDVPAQPRWSAPRTARYTYPLAPEENLEKRCQTSLSWLTCDIRDTFEVLVLSVLEQVLLGNAASPLRKVLMDSGLGSALSDASGYDADNRDTLFSCGLKDVSEGDAETIEGIIMDELKRLVKEGLDPEMIASAIHQIEFHRKEVTNTPYPYGLRLLLMSIGSWLHGGDPERILQLDADFSRLHQEIGAGPFLENRIKTYFLDNPHRVRLILAPDTDMAREEQERTRRELALQWEQLDAEARRQIEKDALLLKERQESQEEVSSLPTLELSDIPTQVQTCAPTHVDTDLPLWRYAQPTSGIYYFNGVAGAAAIDRELLPWVPFFCYAFTRMGTRRNDYLQMARRMDAASGGLGLNAQARVVYNRANTCLPLIQLNTKCLARNIDPVYGIVEELITENSFHDMTRLKQLLGEYRSGLESMIVQNGHRLAISLSSRTFAPSSALSEIWGGVHQVRTIRDLATNVDDARLEALAGRLASIAQAVFTPDNFIMAAIGEPEAVAEARTRTLDSPFFAALKRDPASMAFPMLPFEFDPSPPHEGWSTSSAVAFVAQTLRTVSLEHPDAPVLAVLSKMLRSLYLHREIREKGGAYGGFALYNPENGLFSLASYRDPHIVPTLQVYAGVINFLKTAPISDEDVKEAVLQVCSEFDKPDPPGPAARKAFGRLIVGLSDADRSAFKANLLKTTRAQVLSAAETYFAPGKSPIGIAVIAGQEHLTTANAQLGDNPLTLKTI